MTPPRPSGLRLLVLAAALAVLGAACSDDDDGGEAATDATTLTSAAPSADDIVEGLDLVQEGKLTACTDVPRPPFEFEENGALDGIDIELVRAVAGRLGIEPDFRQVDGDGIFSALNDRQCDLVASSVRITDERKESLDMSDAYFEVDQSLLVRKGDEATFNELEKLRGRTIGVQSGTTGAAFAEEAAQGATIRRFTGADELFTALAGGQVDAVLQDLPVNAYHAQATGETVVAKVFPEGAKEQYGFAMRKGDTALVAAVNDALKAVRSDDTYPTILRRFLGVTAGQI